MHIITGEFVALCLLIFVGTRLKSRLPSTESVLRGLVVYLPPSKELIDQARKSPKQFTINIGKIDDTFSRASQYFSYADLLSIIAVLTLLINCLSILFATSISYDRNLSFYMCFTVIFLSISGMYSQLSQGGIKNPDNILAFFFTLSIFFFGSLLLYMDHQVYFDFNFHFSLKILSLKLTSALQNVFPVSFEADPMTGSIVLSSIAAVCLFPYFKYTFRYGLSYYTAISAKLQDEHSKAPTWKFPFLIVSPLIITVMWVKPMLKNLAVPEYMTEGTFECLRVCVVLAIVLIRFSNIRSEVQHFLNQSKHIIYGMIEDPSDSNIENSTLQCKALASYAWPLAHQSLCTCIIMLFLILLLLNKGEITKPYPTPVEENEVVSTVPEYLDEEEFIMANPAQYLVVTPSKTVMYYKEIRQLELEIAESKNLRLEDDLAANTVKLMKSQFIPPVFYRDFLEFFIWWHGVTGTLISIVSVLYSRRFYNK